MVPPTAGCCQLLVFADMNNMSKSKLVTISQFKVSGWCWKWQLSKSHRVITKVSCQWCLLWIGPSGGLGTIFAQAKQMWPHSRSEVCMFIQPVLRSPARLPNVHFGANRVFWSIGTVSLGQTSWWSRVLSRWKTTLMSSDLGTLLTVSDRPLM